jgi:RNA polymerase sigma-70 factor (sigma-E family)
VEGEGPGSFEDVVVAIAPRLRRSAMLLTGDRDLAEDLVQTVLIKLLGRWGRPGGIDAPIAYAQRVLFTTFCAWSGRRWTGEVPTAVLPEVAAADPFEASTTGAVHASLMALPRRQRAVLVARFYEDLSVEQTAMLLDLSISNVKAVTARALEQLRAELGAQAAAMEGS